MQEKDLIEIGRAIVGTQQALENLSNEIKKSSESSDKNSYAMNWLTISLVFVGIAQVIIATTK